MYDPTTQPEMNVQTFFFPKTFLFMLQSLSTFESYEIMLHHKNERNAK